MTLSTPRMVERATRARRRRAIREFKYNRAVEYARLTRPPMIGVLHNEVADAYWKYTELLLDMEKKSCSKK